MPSLTMWSDNERDVIDTEQQHERDQETRKSKLRPGPPETQAGMILASLARVQSPSAPRFPPPDPRRPER